jgi:nicotinic acid mononucleotide adenylyltransferase
MIKRFKNYIVEGKNTVVFSFGRLNPPSAGHEKLLDKMKSVAGSNQMRMYLSQSQDSNRNPLSYQEKIKWTRKMFPKYGRNIILDKSIKTAFDVMKELHKQGFTDVTMVVGSDRLREFKILLNKYNNKEYTFNSIDVVSSGERDEDQISATKMRKAASDSDIKTFNACLPSHVSDRDTKLLMAATRSGLGLKESTNFKNHIQLNTVSDTREKYVSGDLYFPGDIVVCRENEEVFTIKYCGSNYVLVETDEGKKKRMWLDSIQPLDEKSDEWYADKPEWGTAAASEKAKQVTPGEKIKKKIKENIRDPYAASQSSVEKLQKIQKIKSVRRKQLIDMQHDKILDNGRLRRAKLKNKGINPKV